MALTMLPPSEGNSRLSPTTPVVHAEGTRSVVALRGDPDISTRPELCDVLCRVIADGTGDVVIDLAKATFIDTAIVRALATAQQLLDRQDRVLTIRSPSTLATRVLQVFGMTDLIENPQSRLSDDSRRVDGAARVVGGSRVPVGHGVVRRPRCPAKRRPPVADDEGGRCCARGYRRRLPSVTRPGRPPRQHPGPSGRLAGKERNQRCTSQYPLCTSK